MQKYLFSVLFLLFTMGGFLLYSHLSVQPDEPVTSDSSFEATDPVDQYATVSLSEKVGQLFIVGHWAKTPVASTTALIKDHHLGGVVIMSVPEDPTEIKEWVRAWQAVSPTPLIIAIDQEGGPVSRLRGPAFTTTSQREITDVAMAYHVGKARGAELAKLGINMNFAPVLESATHPTSFLYERVFVDKEQSAILAAALLEGMATAGVTGVIKHFPGHPDTAEDSHTELPQVPITQAELDVFTAPFAEIIKNNPPVALMTAHVLFPKIDPQPATLSPFFLTSYLRDELGYSGLIITDDMIMRAVITSTASDAAAVQAVTAGADIVLFAAEPELVLPAITQTLEAVGTGTLPLTRIDDSYQRVRAFKNTLRTSPIASG